MYKRLLAVASLALALLATSTIAQIDPNQLGPCTLAVYQQDRVVGKIYVAPRQDPCRYVENWFLFEDYVYPSAGNGASFSVEPTGTTYRSLEGFLREMKAAHPAGTHIDVFSAEHREGCE